MGARIELRRRLEWIDTDAAGVWHHSTLWRLAEWAEAELHRRIGITDLTFGWTPRRRVEAEFLRPVVFDEEVVLVLEVAAVGRTSVTYVMDLSTASAEPVATARMVAVLIDDDGAPRPWPEDARAALAHSRI